MTNYEKLIEKAYGEPLIEILRDRYIIKGMPAYKIAAELGVAHTTMLRWLKKYRLHYKRPAWNKGLTGQEIKRILELEKEEEDANIE